MPEPEDGAAEELDPTPNDTTPADPVEPAGDDGSADLAASKIADLTLQLTVKDQRIAELQRELDAAKAHNYDLLMSGNPADTEDDEIDSADDADDEIDPEDTTIESILYEKA